MVHLEGGKIEKGRIIRIANNEDIEEVLDLYSYYIQETTITFEYEVPTIEVFRKRVEAIQKDYPWIVYIEEDRVKGYAYASRQRERAAYQWNVELSIYMSKDYQGTGVGTRLYSVLLDILKEQGYCNAYGCITIPNEKSIYLHKRLGFYEIGVFPNAGNKFNEWHDIIWFGKQLNEYKDNMEIPRKISEIDKGKLEKIMSL